MTPFHVGDRVRTRTEIDIYPVALLPAGLLGTVTWVAETRCLGGIVAYVRLDDHCPALDGWDNELQVFPDDDPEAGCGAVLSQFERVGAF